MTRLPYLIAAQRCGLSISLLLAGHTVAQSALAADPAAPVFVADAAAQTAGAPTKESLGTVAILTDLAAGDPYEPVLRLLEERKQPAATIRYSADALHDVRDALLACLPEFVIVVTRPERIDVNLQFAMLELAAGLDGDPFVDFAHGYVTGATPEEALAFAERCTGAGRKVSGRRARSVLDFGPAANGKLQEGGPAPHQLAKGWKRSWLYHGSVEQMLERQAVLAEHGVLRAGGHGEPDRVVDGLSARDLRAADGLDLRGALYFSGPCYCGVTVASFRPGPSGMIERRTIDPLDSFGLAVLARGAGALFAGLDPDRGEQSEQELEHLWMNAGALGHAMKDTYDGTTVALRQARYELIRYEEAGPRPQKELAMTMIGGAASRALFGDPTAVPYPKPAAEHPLGQPKIKESARQLSVTLRSKRLPNAWQCRDVFRCGGGWTHRLALRREISDATARSLQRLVGVEVESKDGAHEGRFPTAMVERWGGRAFLHLYVVFEPGGLPPRTRDLRATFHFEKAQSMR